MIFNRNNETPMKKLLIPLLVISLTACQNNTGTTNNQTGASPSMTKTNKNGTKTELPNISTTTLESHKWVLSKATLADGSRYDGLFVNKDEPLSLVFNNGNVMINGSCNQLGANYTVENQAVNFGFWISTRMACHGELGKLDALATGAVTGKYTLFKDGDRLGIKIENETSIAEFLAVDAQ